MRFAALLLTLTGCATSHRVEFGEASPPTSSAVIFRAGDDAVRDAIVRVTLAGDSRVIESMLEGGAFNDTLSDEEASAFLDLARRIPVRADVGGRDPCRGARRLIYAMLAARVVATGRWSEADDWLVVSADDPTHVNDLVAGFAVRDWWPHEGVAAPRSEGELDEWRSTFARLLAAATDGMAKSRLVGNAHSTLGLLPSSGAEPEAARRRAAEFICGLIEREPDEATKAALVRALAATGFVSQ